MFHSTPISELSLAPFDILNSGWMLITAGKENNINTMTASWGGLGTMWGKPVAFVVIRPQRYTREFVDASETFSLSFFEESFKKQLRYLGSVSGRSENKITESGLSPLFLDGTPSFEEASMVMTCKKLFVQALNQNSFLDKEICEKWYPNSDFHLLYIAEITGIFSK